MKYKKIILFIIILVSFIIFSVLFYNIKIDVELDTNTLGYCPTMREYAIQIQNLNPNLDISEFSSTAEVIRNLNSNNIEYALVGRKVRDWELENYNLLILREGYTLIGPSQVFINYADLNNLVIHTYLDESIVDLYFENKNNFVFYDSFEDAIKTRNENVVFINWSDYSNSFELVIPVIGPNKVEKFRLPIIYTLKDVADLDLPLI